MSDDAITRLEVWAEPILRSLEPTERRRAMGRIAAELRRNNQRRLRGQRAPDDSRWQPRKIQAQARARRGRIRRGAMFRKLRTARYLRLGSAPSSARLYFQGRAARIAAIHHHGLRDRVSRRGPVYDYPARQLLGFGRDDRDAIEQILIDHIDPN